jgi:hypothetical protein
MMELSLPSGVIIDGESKTIVFPLSALTTLTFSFEEWRVFNAIVEEANLVFETSLTDYTYACGSCGIVNTVLEIEEPNEEDIN